jgi:hypothetical protein
MPICIGGAPYQIKGEQLELAFAEIWIVARTTGELTSRPFRAS